VNVIVTGANDVYVVRGPRGEILLPALSDVILDIDVDARQMVVHVPPGLLPGDTGE
jgi:16S rRNA processing protein RimM